MVNPAEDQGLAPQLDLLIDAPTIADRVRALAAQISADYAGGGRLHLIAVLKGSWMFLADLTRALHPGRLAVTRAAGR